MDILARHVYCGHDELSDEKKEDETFLDTVSLSSQLHNFGSSVPLYTNVHILEPKLM